MQGLLKEKSEIEKLQQEFKMLTEQNCKTVKPAVNATIEKEELVLEECES
ncbi:hypothetical protein [Flavobacterium maritimum]